MSTLLHNAIAVAGWGMPGMPEMIIMGVIALVIFGPKRLPQLSRALGKSITDFKKGLNDIKGDIEEAGKEAEEAEAKTAKAKEAEAAAKKAESPEAKDLTESAPAGNASDQS